MPEPRAALAVHLAGEDEDFRRHIEGIVQAVASGSLTPARWPG
jgi:hypothetical protein